MGELNPNYIIAVAEQLSFVSAFLGGISATILVTIVVFTSPNKSVNWIVGAIGVGGEQPVNCSGFILAVNHSVAPGFANSGQ